MDFLKNHLARLQKQFNALSASQKMLTVSLIAIMVMTLLWWGRYAGQAEMEPVIEQDFNPEDIARVTGDLRSKGIAYTVSGARILVPSDRKTEVLGSLIYEDMLPHDSATPLLELLDKSSSVFDSTTKFETIANEGRQQYLATIIRNFPQVKHAYIALSQPQHRTIGSDGGASAMVYIQMKPGTKPDNRIVNAAADVVAGAISGLNRANVHVIIDGVSHAVASDPGDPGGGGGNYLDQIRDAEKYFADKIASHFSYCDGVMAEVAVKYQTESSDINQKAFNAKGVITKENENEHEIQTTGAHSGGGDPGVMANSGSNQGMSVGGDGGGGGSGTATDKEHSKSAVFVPETDTTTHSPAGSCTVTSASVAFPLSYFIKAYQRESHSDKAPSDTILQPYIQQRLDKMKAEIRACVDVSDTAVVVNTYTESEPIDTAPPTEMTGGVTVMLSGHVREIALGALALMSLFMVPMIVRKSGPSLALTGAGGVGGGGAIEGLPAGATVDAILAKAAAKAEVAAEVGEGGRTLDGIELDEETIRSQQVLEQVSTLVKDNPDAAANLIKRWVSRS